MTNLTVTPEYNDAMEAMTTQTPAHCDQWNVRHQQLLNNDAALRNAICRCTKTATLPAGQSTVTFDISDMPEDGVVTFVSSSPSLSYTGVNEDTANKQLTVSFAPTQTADVVVKMVVKDATI